MKYVKIFALVLSILLIAYLIYVAISNNNLILAGTFSVFFFAISYFGIGITVKSLKLDANDTLLEINAEDKNEK